MTEKSHIDPLVNLLYNDPEAKYFTLIPDIKPPIVKAIPHTRAIENVTIATEKVRGVFLFRVITKEMEMKVQIPKENKDILIKATKAANEGFNLLDKNPNEAIKLLREAVDLFNLAGGYEIKGDMFSDIGLAYSWVHMHEEALRYFNQALEIFENNDLERYVSVLINRASLYEESNEWTKALEDLNNANLIADKNSFGRLQVVILNNIAYILYCQRKFEDALEKYKKVLSIKLELNYFRTSLAQTYFDIAVIYEDIGKIEEAINSYKKCLELLEFKFQETKLPEVLLQVATADSIKNLEYLIKDHIDFLESKRLSRAKKK